MIYNLNQEKEYTNHDIRIENSYGVMKYQKVYMSQGITVKYG